MNLTNVKNWGPKYKIYNIEQLYNVQITNEWIWELLLDTSEINLSWLNIIKT